ncbi:fimbrial protein [Pantoea endophytica]|uniref:fimbrial protein n=1 Tax=Pantoea endophytica TaxID=92488 RepID=UPI003016091E
MTISRRIFWILAALIYTQGTQASIEITGGEIRFSGRMVAQPCVVDGVSKDFNVDMGHTSTHELKRNDGKSKPVSFDIVLNCSSTVNKAVKVYFAGKEETNSPGGIAIIGEAAGIALHLMNKDETAININDASSSIPLAVGQNVLPFLVYVQALSNVKVTPGDYTANATFSLRYD